MISIVPVNRSHLSCIIRWRNLPEIKDGFFSDIKFNPDLQEKWYKSLAFDDSKKPFVIINNGEPIGTIALNNINYESGVAEYGNLLIDPGYQGNGFAFDASKQLIEIAFNGMSLHKLLLYVKAGNSSAIDLYDRLGFSAVSNVNIDGHDAIEMHLNNGDIK
jgi:diamine N-acetyltransferase